MTSAPKLTIGLPVYNGEPWLTQSLRSLLNQTYRDFILLISDNASTDGTAQICQSLAREDGRLQYHRNARNIGVFRNYENVFLQSKTQYFKWASANDLCASTFVQESLAALEANPKAVLVYPRTVVFTDDPERGEDYRFDVDIRDKSPVDRFMRALDEIRLNNAFNGIIRADALRKTSLNKVYRGSDIVLLAELALQGEIVQIPQRLFFRRVSPETASSLRDSVGQKEFFAAEGRDVLGMPTWDFHWHCFWGVLKAPVPFREKLQCALHVTHRFWWRRFDFWREFREKLGGLVTRRAPSVPQR